MRTIQLVSWADENRCRNGHIALQFIYAPPLKRHRHPRSRPAVSVVPHCCKSPGSTDRDGIILSNVNYWWSNGRRALVDLSLRVEPGELAMIVGRNGCGKSTLLRTARGLLQPGSGEVFLEEPCSFVHQKPDMQIIMPTIGWDISMSVQADNEKEVKERVKEALTSVGLVPPEDFMDVSSHRLSGGQKQRAVVAAALAREPRTILFDEVTASMDAVSKLDLIERIRAIVDERRIASLWYVVFTCQAFWILVVALFEGRLGISCFGIIHLRLSAQNGC